VGRTAFGSADQGGHGMRYPHFDFYPGDWLDDANNRYQSLAAKGAHIELLCLMWREATETQFGLLDDDRGLARALGLPLAEWQALRVELIDGPYAVLRVENGRIVSPRLRQEWHKARERSRAAQQSRQARAPRPRVTLPPETSVEALPDADSNDRTTNVPRPLDERATNVVRQPNDRATNPRRLPHESATSHQSPVTDQQSPPIAQQSPVRSGEAPPQEASPPGPPRAAGGDGPAAASPAGADRPEPVPRRARASARAPRLPPDLRRLVAEWRAAVVADGLAPPRDWHLRASGYVRRWAQAGASIADLRAWWAWLHDDPWWATRYPEVALWDRAWSQWRLRAHAPPRGRPPGELSGAAAVDALLAGLTRQEGGRDDPG